MDAQDKNCAVKRPDGRASQLSLREAARMQSFPDSYVFDADKATDKLQMVANAVPPQFSFRLMQSWMMSMVAVPPYPAELGDGTSRGADCEGCDAKVCRRSSVAECATVSRIRTQATVR